jgi:hypothetical protein
VPAAERAGLAELIEKLGDRLTSLDWRVHDLAIAPVASLQDVPDGLLIKRGDPPRAASEA